MTNDSNQAHLKRQQMAGDPYRPLYHFLPPANWMNDPNGAIYWKGKYHLFYQYNPNGAFHGTIHWGHTVSEDLVHWTDLPIALSPTPGGADREGCYSGGAVVNDGVPTLIYFGNPDGNCIATSTDDLLTWQKPPENPVIPQSAPGAEWRAFDPCAWREGDTWYSLAGGRLDDIGDTAFLFRSPDMINWEYLHPFYASELDKEPESDCAVPDFFPLGGKHMLLFASHERGVQYYIGAYADQKFYPERHGRLNFGEFGGNSGHLCASITLKDGGGRRIFFGWVSEGRSEAVQRASGWAGVMCIPRVLSLFDDDTLRIEPVPEIEKLRGNHRRTTGLRVSGGSSVRLEGISGDCLELDVELDPGGAEAIGVKVRCAPDGGEQTIIAYDRKEKRLILDAAQSSVNPDAVNRGAQRAPFALDAGELLQLRIFVDRSIVEVFANKRVCLTKRIYPSGQDSVGVEVFALGGEAAVKSVDAWQMAAIWPE